MEVSKLLDNKKLHEIGQKSTTAQVVSSNLALRERMRHESDITRLRRDLVKQGEPVDESEYMEYWKELAALGAGSIVYGRRGKPDRFQWRYSLKDVAKVMVEGNGHEIKSLAPGKAANASKDTTKKVKEPGKKQHKRRAKAVVPVVKAKKRRGRPPLTAVQRAGRSAKLFKTHMVLIPLRKDFMLQLNLPKNISTNEIEVIREALSHVLA